MYIIVGSKWDSALDELYSLDEEIDFIGGIQQYWFEEELREIFGEELANIIMKAYEDAKMKEITGTKAKNILKLIDKYYDEEYDAKTDYVKRYKDGHLVVYELLV